MNEVEPTGASPIPPGSRNYTGWVILTLLFGLFITIALKGALTPGEKKEESFAAQEMQLRILTSQGQLLKTVSASTPAEDRKRVEEQTRESLDEAVSDLVPKAEKSAPAARMYAVMRTEQRKEIPAKMLDALRKSDDPLDKTYLEIYGVAKLTPDEAQRLADRLPKRPFVNELAAVHALEKGGSTTARGDRISPWVAARMMLAAFIGLGLFACGMVVWGVYLAGRRTGKFSPKGHPIGRVTLPDADRLAIRAAQILSAFFGLQILAGYLVDRNLMPAMAGNIFLGLGILGIIGALAAFPIGGKRITLKDIGVTKDRLGKNILWGIVGFLAELPVTLMLAMIGAALLSFLPTPSHPATQAVTQAENILSILPLLLFGAIIAPIWEEILFRGTLFPAIGRVAGSVLTGALVSSLLFALIHPQGPILVPALAGVGAMSCGLAYQTRSLIPSIVMHILHNTTIFTIALLMT
ncbi:MAG: CPBP family intramembrane glutamic endopeptidase [Fimbriimonas sp.]